MVFYLLAGGRVWSVAATAAAGSSQCSVWWPLDAVYDRMPNGEVALAAPPTYIHALEGLQLLLRGGWQDHTHSRDYDEWCVLLLCS